MHKKGIFFMAAIFAVMATVVFCREPNNHGERETTMSVEAKANRVMTVATFVTSKGVFSCELFPDVAPLSVKNFIALCEKKFYSRLTFHRVIPGFVVQGGDPSGDGTGGPGYTVPAEIKLPHRKGALAWARLSDQVNPTKASSGSQFYIALEELPYLNGEYTVFGQVLQGMDVVEAIEKGDYMESVQISYIPMEKRDSVGGA